MSEYIEVGQPLQFTEPNSPTRVGEIVENVSDIYNIPSPRLGMQVFVKSEKKSYVITSLKNKVIGGVDVPEAAVEAFEPVGAKSITWNNDNNPSNMNDFVVAGVYDIKGIVGNNRGNLPIMNTGENASFAARLVVTVSPEGDTTYRHSIGQTMVVSNSEGKETKVYTRNANVTSYDGGASYVYEWGNWGELQKNVNVDAVTSLDHLVDNGIYSGVLTPTGETFVLVVINNYAFASKYGTQKCISQFKYSVGPFGVVSFGKRVKIGNANFPAEWDILNKKEIDRMLNNAVEQVISTLVNDAPEAFDTLKEIADWIANDETGAVALANATKANAAAITAERTRAIGQEGLLNNAIAGEKSRAEQAEQTIDLKLDEEARRATQAEGEINQNTIAADSMSYSTTTDDISLEFDTLDGKSHGGVTFPAATTEKAGVMSAEDKKALDAVPNTIEAAISEEAKATDEKIAKEKVRAEQAEQAIANDIANAPNLALRALFVAAGAEYNDSGIDKSKTAPWGETVTHKAGHYYLNGLGDITEGQMVKIYNRGNFNDADIAPFSDSYSHANNIRTNLPRVGSWNGTLQPYLSRSNSRIEVITLHVARFSVAEICNINFANTESLFIGSSALSVIDTRCRLAPSNWSGNSFKNCVSLKEVRIEKLKNNLVFAQSSQISKASVLFAIEKATPTSAITITLHPDAYARLANDADIVAALEAQPLVTLVSA